MLKHTGLLLALATLSATTAISTAQNAYPASPGNYQGNSQINNSPMQAQPAPIERGSVAPYGYNRSVTTLAAGQVVATTNHTASTLPAAGIFLRVGERSSVRAVTLGAENTELRVEHGIANISVDHPIKHAQILVDLPGGQTVLIKDGFYTFNADTNTIRVLKGEAFAYPGANTNQEPVKVKEDHAVIFSGPRVTAFEFDPFQARTDLIPYAPRSGGSIEPGPSGYYAPPYAGYPYYDYGYPYYYGYPFFGGYGGYGFYGGGYGGGFHGGGGGFHGGGGHGGGGHH